MTSESSAFQNPREAQTGLAWPSLGLPGMKTRPCIGCYPATSLAHHRQYCPLSDLLAREPQSRDLRDKPPEVGAKCGVSQQSVTSTRHIAEVTVTPPSRRQQAKEIAYTVPETRGKHCEGEGGSASNSSTQTAAPAAAAARPQLEGKLCCKPACAAHKARPEMGNHCYIRSQHPGPAASSEADSKTRLTPHSPQQARRSPREDRVLYGQK